MSTTTTTTTTTATTADTRCSVLIIEDEQSVARALQRLLRSSHDTTAVTSGREALACLDAADGAAGFDVILCDLMMPGMTGMDLHAEIARRDPHLAGRMIFITGGAFTARARAFLDTVDNARIEKPVDADRLIQLLDEVAGCR